MIICEKYVVSGKLEKWLAILNEYHINSPKAHATVCIAAI